jgi:glycosyltransferase involved in cell wall biosynthesis
MARVLHLLEKNPDYQSQSALDQLLRDGGGEVRSIGRGGDFSLPWLATWKLRKLSGGFDLVHAWGGCALAVATIGSAKKIIYSPTEFPDRQSLRWLRAVMSGRDLQVICPTDTMRKTMVENGVPIERCHLIRPGVDFAKVNRRRNDELREKFGFGGEDIVLLSPGESLREANHRAAILAMSVLHLMEPKYKLLIWNRGPTAAAERRFAEKMLPETFVTFATQKIAEVQFEQLLQASDAALITADAPAPPLPIAVCMAAGLPIVAVVSSTIAELLEDRHSALFATRHSTRLIARRVLDLRDDPQLAWQIADAAKTEAFEFFSMTRFVNQMRAVYEQVVKAQQVEVPQQAPGAGMRFAGRG